MKRGSLYGATGYLGELIITGLIKTESEIRGLIILGLIKVGLLIIFLPGTIIVL